MGVVDYHLLLKIQPIYKYCYKLALLYKISNTNNVVICVTTIERRKLYKWGSYSGVNELRRKRFSADGNLFTSYWKSRKERAKGLCHN